MRSRTGRSARRSKRTRQKQKQTRSPRSRSRSRSRSRRRRSYPTAGFWSAKKAADASAKAPVNGAVSKLKRNKKRQKKDYPKQCFLCDDPACTDWKKCQTFPTHRPDPKDPTQRLLLKNVKLEEGDKFPGSIFEKDILPKMRESRKKKQRPNVNVAKTRSAIKKVSVMRKSPKATRSPPKATRSPPNATRSLPKLREAAAAAGG